MNGVVKDIADRIRLKPAAILSIGKNCLCKSLRFKRLCRESGIEASVVLSFGYVRARPLGVTVILPTIHAWGGVGGERIEIAASLDKKRVLGYFDCDIKPVFTTRI